MTVQENECVRASRMNGQGVVGRVIEAAANLDPVLVALLTNPPHLYLSSQNLIGGSRRILTAGAI